MFMKLCKHGCLETIITC